MRHFRQSILILTFLSITAVFAQTGTIRGTIKDAKTMEPLIGAKVMVETTSIGDLTDLDGNFELKVAAGTYSIKISYILYQTTVLTDIVVEADKVIVLDNVLLNEETNTLGTVVVSTSKIENTEISITQMEKNAINTIDAIGQESMKKSGDGDAVSAIQRVPGISVAGGKYVYVRGLGDRYNKTILNGSDIPGLDPDRNTLQMDIFPTSVIDNIVVHKTFVAELPADFTGGIIDINVKAFPDKKQSTLSFSAGYNPYFHFNSNYLTYKGSATDFLGFDNGLRSIPAVNNIPFFSQAVANPNGEAGLRYQEILGGFNKNLAAYRQTSLFDYSIAGSFGNQLTKEKYSIGFNIMASYKNSTEFYSNATYGRYGLSADPNVYEMEVRELQTGEFGVNNVLLTGMAGIALKTNYSKIQFMALHLQNGESKAGIFDYLNSDQGAVFYGFQHNLEYSQRSLTNLHLEGTHVISEKDWEINWKLSPTYSTISDPDIRFTRYEERTDGYFISTESGFPERIWRNLTETNLNAQVNVIKTFELFKRDAKFKFGAGYSIKQRDFIVRSFALNVRDVILTGDPNELFAEENIWPSNGDPTKGTTFEANFIPTNPNKFDANVTNTSGYASIEMSPAKKLKAILGVRVENYVQRYTGQDQLGTNVLTNDKVLNNLGIFPNGNFVYEISDKQNLRFSYGKTIARPSFKELSYAEIYDPLTGRTFIGGLFRDADDASGKVYWDGNLVSTDIHNLDLRWEIYNKPGQSFSVSAFYKKFINPIEIVQFSAQAGSFQPRNVGDGEVLGGEIEMRQTFEFISEKMKDLSLSLNFTYNVSRIEMSETEYESRVANARTGQVIDRYRAMAGQSPYLINAGLHYKSSAEKGFFNSFEAGIYYNVQGRTLEYVGIVDRPDIYTNSFHSLNFNTNKSFGKDNKFQIGLKVENILNDKKESVFVSYMATDQYFSQLNPGTTLLLRFGIKF